MPQKKISRFIANDMIDNNVDRNIMKLNFNDLKKKGFINPTTRRALISEEITLHNNVYVHIHSVNFWKIYNLEGKQDLVNINYKVFESKEARENNPYEFILEDHLIGQKLDFNIDTNQMQKCYEYVKNIRGIEELIND